MKLKATEVQTLLGVEDGEVICHGYTFDRKTVDIFFERGQLVRAEEGVWDTWDSMRSDDFEPDFFLGTKRWYTGTPERGINQRLVSLFETFGNPLPLTEGGRY